MSKKKVLVTGSSGFIGSHVINQLLANNCEVVASDISEDKARTKSWFDQVRFISHEIGADVNDQNLYQKFEAPDHMIHLAWFGLPNYKALFHFEENLPKQYYFLKNLVSNGLEDLTVTGTCFEYGNQSGCLTELMTAAPNTSYALAKNTLRLFLEELQKNVDFKFKWVRLFYLYGEGQNPNSLLPQLDRALENKEDVFNMSGGEQIRDYLPVEKVAAHLVSICLQDNITGIINCSSNKPLKVKELVADYLKSKKKHIKLNLGYYPYSDFEPMEFWGDNNKLRLIIGNDV